MLRVVEIISKWNTNFIWVEGNIKSNYCYLINSLWGIIGSCVVSIPLRKNDRISVGL